MIIWMILMKSINKMLDVEEEKNEKKNEEEDK